MIVTDVPVTPEAKVVKLPLLPLRYWTEYVKNEPAYPPVFDGALHSTSSDLLPTLTVSIDGAPGRFPTGVPALVMLPLEPAGFLAATCT